MVIMNRRMCDECPKHGDAVDGFQGCRAYGEFQLMLPIKDEWVEGCALSPSDVAARIDGRRTLEARAE